MMLSGWYLVSSPFLTLLCSRSSSMGLCGSNEALNVGGAALYLRSNHDSGDSAHGHRYANERTNRPDRTGRPPCENQYAQQYVGGGIQEKPSPAIHWFQLERSRGEQSRLDQQKSSKNPCQGCYASNGKECQRDTANSIE
jgi:hypothetical protein